eukprot:327991-Rhodomonas_salina.1
MADVEHGRRMPGGHCSHAEAVCRHAEAVGSAQPSRQPPLPRPHPPNAQSAEVGSRELAVRAVVSEAPASLVTAGHWKPGHCWSLAASASLAVTSISKPCSDQHQQASQ